MRILFVHQRLSTFVKRDLEILSEEYNVRDFYFEGWKDLGALWKEVKRCDVTFSWFCSSHAFAAVLFSKMLGKKSMVVAGGYDVANVLEIGYGVYYGSAPVRRIKKLGSRLTFRFVDIVLAVSEFNRFEALRNAKVNPKKIRLIYNAVDTSKFSPRKGTKKANIVVTAGAIDSNSVKMKGYELFVKSAQFLPNVQFFLAGKWLDNSISYLRDIAPANVHFPGGLSAEELAEFFSRAKVYVQVSVYESFGCALAEAMSCECVPVVSRRAALPEVVGDCGFYVDELRTEAVADKIEEALAADEDVGKSARNRIKKTFPKEKRKRELIELLDTLIMNN